VTVNDIVENPHEWTPEEITRVIEAFKLMRDALDEIANNEWDTFAQTAVHARREAREALRTIYKEG